jgi:cytochrome c oxidase subunit 2
MLAGLLIGVVTAAAVALFFLPPAWFPPALSPEALLYDSQFRLNLLLLGPLFLLAQGLLVFILLRGRIPGARRSALVEGAAAAVVAGIFTVLGITGARAWSATPSAQPPEVIEVYAHQFAWNFRYPGPDGRFGKTDIALINDAALNPIGLDLRDANAADDVVASTLRVPAGRPVTLMLESRDVIHDFFVRELRLKQDIVPGMRIPYRFQANRPGTYEIACAELCGLGHSQMHSLLQVLSEADYQAWKASPRTAAR